MQLLMSCRNIKKGIPHNLAHHIEQKKTALIKWFVNSPSKFYCFLMSSRGSLPDIHELNLKHLRKILSGMPGYRKQALKKKD